jgi:hypothetical protein
MTKFLRAAAAILLLAGMAGAAEKDAKTRYEALVQRVRAGDQTADLNELRLAAGEAGIESDVDARDRLMTTAANHDFKKMAEAADAVLKSNYADLDGHFFARVAAKELGKPELEEFHRWVEMGLLKSLRSSGDGKSPETAMKVISVDEEYFILRMMGQMPGHQALSKCAGAPCDIMTTTDPESKQEYRWYFNVEIPMKREAEALEEANKPKPKGKK